MTFPSFSPNEILTSSDMNAVGMWRVASGDLSGNAFVLNNVFTADYRNYRIVFSNVFASAVTASTALEFYLRTGATNTTNGFFYGNNFLTYAGTPATGTFGGNNVAFWNLTYATNVTTAPASMVFDLLGPQLAAPTQFSGFAVSPDSSRWGAGAHQVSTQYDGFQLKITGAGITLSGRYAVYGYRN